MKFKEQPRREPDPEPAERDDVQVPANRCPSCSGHGVVGADRVHTDDARVIESLQARRLALESRQRARLEPRIPVGSWPRSAMWMATEFRIS